MYLNYIYFTLISFISGSILYSYMIGKRFCNIDITSLSEDHNPGATNVFKYANTKLGILALVLDIFKGLLPVLLAAKYLDIEVILFSFVMVAPVLGHAISPFLKGKGGKAIAASFGCLLGLLPHHFIVFALAFILIILTFIFRISPDSLRCIIAYTIFCGFCLRFVHINSIRYGCIAIAMIVITKHIMTFDFNDYQFELYFWNKIKTIFKT